PRHPGRLQRTNGRGRQTQTHRGGGRDQRRERSPTAGQCRLGSQGQSRINPDRSRRRRRLLQRVGSQPVRRTRHHSVHSQERHQRQLSEGFIWQKPVQV